MDADPVPAADEPTPLRVDLVLGRPSVITVAGDSDYTGLSPLRQAVDEALAHDGHVAVDLSGVTFADSTFLNVLLAARNSAVEQAGSLRLLAASTPVQRLLDVTGAATLFPVQEPRDPGRS
jgi:anti-sigma B factor antagonist